MMDNTHQLRKAAPLCIPNDMKEISHTVGDKTYLFNFNEASGVFSVSGPFPKADSGGAIGVILKFVCDDFERGKAKAIEDLGKMVDK